MDIKTLALKGAEKYLPGQIEFLKTVCSVDCKTANLEGNLKVVEAVEKELQKIEGIKIRRYELPGYGIDVCAYVPCKNPKEKIILNAHTDTVFIDGSVSKAPFHIEGDRLCGLGVGDCKGGIAVCINAVKIAQENGFLPDDKQFVFMFNCDEENGVEEGYRFFDSELPADKAFVFEGAGKNMQILIGRKARATFKIDVEGVRAHSGNGYLNGRSAIVEIAHKIQRIYESNDKENEIFFTFGPVKSEDPLNVLSGHASVLVDARISSKAVMEKAEEIIKSVCEEPPYLEGTKTSYKCVKRADRILERKEENLALYYEAEKAAETLGFDKLGEFVSAGFGDVCYFASKGCAAIDGLGPCADRIHSLEESISIKSLSERTALFACMLAQM